MKHPPAKVSQDGFRWFHTQAAFEGFLHGLMFSETSEIWSDSKDVRSGVGLLFQGSTLVGKTGRTAELWEKCIL